MREAGSMRKRNFRSVELAPALVIPGVDIREIAGFPNYCVGDNGSVWAWHKGASWRKLKPHLSPHGYHKVVLTKEFKKYKRHVHVLVLEAFIGVRPPGTQTCHFPDRDKSNNAISNLRWGTPAENSHDQKMHGTWTHGEKVGISKLRNNEIQSLRDRYASGETFTSIANSRGVNRTTIREAVRGRTWKHA